MKIRMLMAAIGLTTTMATGAARAQVVHVPGDYADLQVAIDQVPPNATIVFSGARYGVVIDKPVTIVGITGASILPEGPYHGVAEPGVSLAGPGAGVVTLVNLHVGAAIGGLAFVDAKPVLHGGGFSEVRLFDCTVDAPWTDDWNDLKPGVDTVDVNVPLLWVERSTIRGGNTSTTSLYEFSQSFDAGSAIRSTGTVVLLDSEVVGGSGPSLEFGDPSGSCPPVCPEGIGGNGVQCERLFQSENSTVTAGVGTSWSVDGTFCCQGAPGVALIVSEHVILSGGLRAMGAPALGQPLSVMLEAPGSSAVLVLSSGVGAPVVVGPNDSFLKNPLQIVGVVQTPSTAAILVPNAPALTGVEFGMQLFGVAGWSRPLAGIVTP